MEFGYIFFVSCAHSQITSSDAVLRPAQGFIKNPIDRSEKIVGTGHMFSLHQQFILKFSVQDEKQVFERAPACVDNELFFYSRNTYPPKNVCKGDIPTFGSGIFC